MKSKKNMKSIIITAVIVCVIMFFINISLAATTATVIVETANLRKTASADSIILDQISVGEEVEIIEKEGEWYKVEFENITGYLREDLIEVNGEISDSTEDEVVEDDNLTQDDTTQDSQEDLNQDSSENIETEEPQNSIYKVKNNINLKIVPSINATDIILVNAGDEVIVVETINDWMCIQIGETKGWIRTENIEIIDTNVTAEVETEVEVETQDVIDTSIEPTTKYVSVESANLRQEPSTSATVISGLTTNDEVKVYSDEDGWSRIIVTSTDEEGYISSSLLSDTKQDTSRSVTEIRTSTVVEEVVVEETTPVETTTTSSSTGGNAIVDIAMQYLGCSYVYGGTTPSGFDCSGFTQYVYKQYGISINRSSSSQYSNGVAVSKSELQAGDLVMFGSGSINHVGIYIGNGNIIHAENASSGVNIDSINSGYYYNNYIGARRII